MSGQEEIFFHVGDLYIVLHGPFPKEISRRASVNAQFSFRRGLLFWLDKEWPDWRNNVVRSKGLS